MNSSNKKINAKLYVHGQMMGLNKKDINNILDNIIPKNEQLSFVAGPTPYLSSFYGTISIKDIQYH